MILTLINLTKEAHEMHDRLSGKCCHSYFPFSSMPISYSLLIFVPRLCFMEVVCTVCSFLGPLLIIGTVRNIFTE